MGDWRRRFRSVVVSSSRIPGIATLLRKTCQIITWEVGRELAGIPGVEAVYTRHSHPRFSTFVPGQSDLDLTIVLDDFAAQSATVVQRCADRIDELNRKFPFVFPQDARFISRRELAQIEASPGAAEILGAPQAWIRIGGREVRQANDRCELDFSRLPLHPEFNAWWLNVMQTHVLTPQVNLAENNLRLCFRVAMKSQLNLQAARSRAPFPLEGYLSDSRAASLFADDAEMTALLGDLERRGFRAEDGETRRFKIFRRSLAEAAEFYRDLPIPLDAEWSRPADDRTSPSIAEAHRSELRGRIQAAPALQAIADSIIIYPTPHWPAREYQIDLILKDEVPSAGFADAVRTIRTSFGGRTFGVGGTHAQLTMVPRAAFEHPWFFLGTPSPFLHEHIANFAETLFGVPPRIPAPPSRVERLRWCAQYLLFHRSTLQYRPRYVSKDCNFCQLAAIHLFLEQDLLLTDAIQISDAYTDAFIKDGEASAMDLLLRPDQQRLDEETFATALKLQSQEYATIEALLQTRNAFSQSC